MSQRDNRQWDPEERICLFCASSAQAVAAQRTDVDIHKAFEIALCSQALTMRIKQKPGPTLSLGTPHKAMERSENPHFTLTRITAKSPFRVMPPEFIADHSFLSY